MKKMMILSKNWYFSVQKASIYYTVNKSHHNSFILLVFSHVANFRYVANFRFLTLLVSKWLHTFHIFHCLLFVGEIGCKPLWCYNYILYTFLVKLHQKALAGWSFSKSVNIFIIQKLLQLISPKLMNTSLWNFCAGRSWPEARSHYILWKIQVFLWPRLRLIFAWDLYFFKHAHRYSVFIKHSYMLGDISLSDRVSVLAVC